MPHPDAPDFPQAVMSDEEWEDTWTIPAMYRPVENRKEPKEKRKKKKENKDSMLRAAMNYSAKAAVPESAE